MKIIYGDIWEYQSNCIIAITTNGSVNKSGEAVMDRGVALQARNRYPTTANSMGVARNLGNAITYNGNNVFYLYNNMISFPVKHKWSDIADLSLIQKSAKDLVVIANFLLSQPYWKRIVIPRPGCGNGGLDWEDVEKILHPVFDDRFRIIDKEKKELDG